MPKEIKFLNNIVLIPIISTLFLLIVSVTIYTYTNYKEGNKYIEKYQYRLLKSKKESLKDRVNFVLSCMDSKNSDLKKMIQKINLSDKEVEKLYKNVQDSIKNTINNFRFSNSGYVFIYKILDFNGGDKFAVMVANPNRKDLVEKFIGDNYKDVEGNAFRKEFLKQIRKKGEAFVTYYYKKPGTNSIKPKLSYFKLYKEWNWVVASGIYLDDLYVISKVEKQNIIKNIKYNNTIIILTSIVILIFSIILSFLVKRVIKNRMESYRNHISKQKKELSISNRKLKIELYRDNLTKLKNRNILIQNLEKNRFFALIIIDIDDFKIINELYGNIFGNKVLIYLSKLLLQYNKENNCKYGVYRLGSDEFALICNKSYDKNEFISTMNDLFIHIVTKDIELIENIKININVTMGVSFEKDEALSKADIALNFAKKSGKRLAIYSREIDNRLYIDKNIKIKKELITAIEQDRIVPFFQPIVNNEFKVIKYESLIRVFLDDDTMLLPLDFLNIAKKSKLYPKLSKIMIQKSFDTFRKSDKYFSVNISINDIINLETMKFIENIIEQNKEVSKRLVFEILESESIEDFSIIKEFINKVRLWGVKIAIDDFGSGYSSFRYILEIKPDFVKIDGSLIANIMDDPDNLVMVKNIVNMTKDLNIITVAEFVSSVEIFEILKDLGVDEFQGFFIGIPSKNLLPY